VKGPEGQQCPIPAPLGCDGCCGQEGGLPAAGAGLAAGADSSCRGSLYVSLYVQSSNSLFFYYSGIRPKLY